MKIFEISSPSSFNDANDKLTSAGWKLLGKGGYAMVWSHPHRNYIIKLFSNKDDSGYLKFLDIVYGFQNNPHFPKISKKLIKFNDNYYGVRMEKLEHGGNSHITMALNRTLDAYVAFYRTGIMKDIPNSKYLTPQLLEALDLIAQMIVDRGLFNDLHRENIMFRGNTIVITDPVNG